MKKFFVALMAVLVLASCAEKKTPADVLGMTTEIMSVTAEKINNAKSADDVEKRSWRKVRDDRREKTRGAGE